MNQVPVYTLQKQSKCGARKLNEDDNSLMLPSKHTTLPNLSFLTPIKK